MVAPRRLLLIRAAFAALLLASGIAQKAEASEAVRRIGDGLRIALPVIAGGTTALKRDAEGFIQFALGFGITTGITSGLKEIVDEQRPKRRGVPEEELGDNSFPSGHASMAFASAAFLDHRYGHTIGFPAYIAASFVAFSRVESDRHHIHDVVASAAIAWIVDRMITTPYRKNVRIGAVYTGDGAELRLSMAW